jgi:CBS domain-containing protein
MNMMVKDVMSKEVVRVSPESKLHAIAVFMRDGDLGSVPVAEGDKLIGMVTDRDIVVRGIAGAPSSTALTARDVMSPDIKYCFEDQSVEEVLENMGTEQIRRLPVLTREKRLVGIVSLGDLAKKTSRSEAGEALEEISQA